MKRIIFIALYLCSTSILGQDLKGKWLKITDDHTLTIPKSVIFEITNQELIIYSFDSIYSKLKLEIDTVNKLFKQGEKEYYREYRYSMKDSLILTKYFKNDPLIEEKKAKIFESDYVKLLSTRVNHPVEKIIKKQYGHFYPSSFIRPETQIKFEGVMCTDQYMEAQGDNEHCDRYRLEKIDNTYLIVYYWKKDQRKWMVPIKEINKDHLLVYGVAGKEGFFKFYEIKAIQNSEMYIPD